MKADSGTNIIRATELLKNNKLVAIPTETVYGLAGNAYSEKALLEIYKVKNRPSFDPLIIHTDSIEKVEGFVEKVPDLVKILASHFSPGPLTFVLPKLNLIPDIATSGLPTVAVRIPDHPLTLELLNLLDFPVAAPSANIFGRISPTSAKHVENQLGDKISYILDGGICKIGIESTIIEVNDNEINVLRLGGISLEEIQRVAGLSVNHVLNLSTINSPGQFKSHYATRTPMLIGEIPELIKIHKDKKLAILSFSKLYDGVDIGFQRILSQNRNLDEAASNLFISMHELDALNCDFILAEVFPETGLGRAINDRLSRAAHV